MRALAWRNQMRHAPRLVHDNGLALIQLGEDSVLFPSEADARFFYEACSDVPALAATNAILRQQIDEKALYEALGREKALSVALEREKALSASLHAQNAELAEKAALASKRARILAIALKHQITP